MKTIRFFVVLIFVLAIPFNVSAQDAERDLEKCVDNHINFVSKASKLSAETVESIDIDDLEDDANSNLNLLDKVIKTGNAEQIKTAKYYQISTKFHLGFYLYNLDAAQKAIKVLKPLESEITALKANDFPMRYKKDGKNFVVTWVNFGPMVPEYYAALGNAYYDEADFDNAYNALKKSIKYKDVSDWTSYTVTNKILDVRAKKKSLVSDDEQLEIALQTMKNYLALGSDNKKIVAENKLSTWERGYKILENARTKATAVSPDLALKFGDTAQLLRGVSENEKAAAFYFIAIKNGWGTTAIYKDEVFPIAKTLKNNDLGILILGKLTVGLSETNCEILENYSKEYAFFGNISKSADFKKKAESCLKKRQTEKERQEEARKKEEERIRRDNWRREHPFNVFVAFDLTPLLQSTQNLGGHIDFRSRKIGHSFGFTSFKQKSDLNSDGQKWSGYKASYALKVYPSMRSGAYSGLYFGYADKIFFPILNSTITPLDGTKPLENRTVIAHDKQYELMLNTGKQSMLGILGVDLYAGIGGSYNRFSIDGYPDLTKVAFSGSENKFYTTRTKAESYNLKLRLGMTIGLNFGTKR